MNFTKIHKTISLVVSILALSLFGGCTTDEEIKPKTMIEYRQAKLPDRQPPEQLPELEPLSPEIEKQIISDYRASLTDKDGRPYTGAVWIDTYCGTYNGYVAVLMNGDFTYEQLHIESIEKFLTNYVSFVYANSNEVRLWKAGQFYKPNYEGDHSLSWDDLKKIAYYNNRKLVPYEDHPALEFLNPEIEKQLLKDYLAYLRSINAPFPYPVRMGIYYGTYNGCVVGRWDPSDHRRQSYQNYPSRDTIIAGTFFQNYVAGSIDVWKEGKFYNMEKAYEKGLLTGNDIRSIGYYRWHSLYIDYPAKAPPGGWPPPPP